MLQDTAISSAGARVQRPQVSPPVVPAQQPRCDALQRVAGYGRVDPLVPRDLYGPAGLGDGDHPLLIDRIADAVVHRAVGRPATPGGFLDERGVGAVAET